MSETDRLDRFVAFSADVTAFSQVELRGTGLAAAYLEKAATVVGQGVLDELLALHAEIAGLGLTDRTIALRRKVFGNERFGPVARSIVKLWYIGTWFELPRDWQERYGPAPLDGTSVVSPDAYVEGLLWPAIGAHPPGAKAPGFGSWQYPPQIPSFPGDPGAPAPASS